MWAGLTEGAGLKGATVRLCGRGLRGGWRVEWAGLKERGGAYWRDGEWAGLRRGGALIAVLKWRGRGLNGAGLKGRL